MKSEYIDNESKLNDKINKLNSNILKKDEEITNYQKKTNIIKNDLDNNLYNYKNLVDK